MIDPDIRAQISEVVAKDGPWPLAFFGAAGSGKTCAALCLIDYYGQPSRYYTTDDACDALRQLMGLSGYRWYTSQSEWQQDWASAHVCCLDELGIRDNVTDFHYLVVKRCIDSRHGLPAIFISNSELAEIKSIYDDRIASRLAGGTVINFPDTDRRVD